MEFQGTNKEWFIKDNGVYIDVKVKIDSHNALNIGLFTENKQAQISHTEALYNAKLAVQAPRMLQLLKEAYEMLNSYRVNMEKDRFSKCHSPILIEESMDLEVEIIEVITDATS